MSKTIIIIDEEDEFPFENMAKIMEMPCRCDCGKMFDLNDGYPSIKRSRNIVVCPACHAEEARVELIESEIESLEQQIEDARSERPYKRHIKALQKKIDALKTQLTNEI